MSPVEVQVVSQPDRAAVEALQRLLPQVSTSAPRLTEARVHEVIANPSTDVIIAVIDGVPVGMALLLRCTTLAGHFGMVEEVAVDAEARGRHVSVHLLIGVLRRAAELRLNFVDLTSRPSREAANNLYRKLGFEVRETNCYRHRLAPVPDPW